MLGSLLPEVPSIVKRSPPPQTPNSRRLLTPRALESCDWDPLRPPERGGKKQTPLSLELAGQTRCGNSVSVCAQPFRSRGGETRDSDSETFKEFFWNGVFGL